MLVINWRSLQPTEEDLAGATRSLTGVVHLRTLFQALASSVLRGFPWADRPDLVPIFDPSQSYAPGEAVALPRQDEQELRPDTWVVGQVETVVQAQNPLQGSFQVVTLRLEDERRMLAAGIPGAKPLPLHFPPEDPEDLKWLVSHVVDTHGEVLTNVVRQAVEAGGLRVILQGDQVLRKDELVPLAEPWQAGLEQRFGDLIQRSELFLPLDVLCADLRAAGWAEGVPDAVARFSLEFRLREAGFRDLGGGRWTSARILEAVGRVVARRPRVPVVRSKVAKEQGVDDTPDFEDYEEVELKEKGAQAALQEAGEEVEPEAPRGPQTLDQWRKIAPANSIRLPPLTYQHIHEAFFPLSKDLAPAFPPGHDPLLVHITVLEGEPLPCLVSREERVIKAVDVQEFANRFLGEGIPAGTYLWLERLGDFEYRVAPRPLPEERVVRCKLLSRKQGRLFVEEADIPMRYEGDPHLFKAELRFEDLEALFQEAKEEGLSIFDAMYKMFPELARLDPDGRVHWKDLFNAVFFRCRMCSPRSVVTELYTRPCFMPVGEGYFRLEPERGITRRPVSRPPGKRPGKPTSEPPVRREPLAPSSPAPQPQGEFGGKPRRPRLPGTEPEAPLFEPAVRGGAAPVAESVEPVRPEPIEAPEMPSEPAPPAPGQPSPSRPAARRPETTAKSLFSQHYLQHRIQEHPEWQEDVSEPLARLQALYDQKKSLLPTLNEAQTESEFIRPILEALGFAYIPQTQARITGRVQRPDYTLFAGEDDKAGAYRLQSDGAAFYARALAIADAKYWERPLSRVSPDDPRDAFRNSNPSFQIVNYLIGTGVDWGILTNGRRWRLYSRQASSTATEFYEADLVDLLESGDLEAFKFFWLFFRREAFVRDAQGRNFLERVREGSTTYAQAVGDRLKNLVFREVFPFLSGGFVAYAAARGQDLTSEAACQATYEATLSLLYKLLFLFYAEARNLLPMVNPGYREAGLTRMAREVGEKVDRAEPLGQTSTALYDRLLNLFRMVDRGDPGLGLPRYNGGLFHFDLDDAEDRDKHRANRFLLQQKVPDAFLAPALERLYRADGQPVDYGFLGVRHLGAIYEGLLEHRLAVEDALAGRVHLETDKGERKATGSYYTPDYIVKYIIRHTLGPILEERGERFGELMKEILKARRQLQDSRRSAGVPALRQKLERLERQAQETLLDIKICDPAMGSGHFLVEAVDFLTDGLIKILNQHPEGNPVLKMLDDIRQDIVKSMEIQGITIQPAALDDTQLLQRVVMKRCIYGVDLNPMAVELAKVSLWLHTFTLGAPLSFLDHHLRCGNSLIGAMAREVEREMAAPGPTGQMTFLSGPFVGLLQGAKIMRGISLLSDATFEEVEKSQELFRGFDEAAKPYKQLLDIYVAQHFGVRHAREFLEVYGRDAYNAVVLGPERVGEPYRTMMREAQHLYREKRFFHWDLEFPEAFIDLERATWKENPGFDAVVGNPPYGFIDDSALQAVLTSQYAATSCNDSYVAFLERGVRILANGGSLSYITPTSWQTGQAHRDLREFVLKTCRISQLVNLPYDVFPEAYIDTSICVLRKQRFYQRDSRPIEHAIETYAFAKRERAAYKLGTHLDYKAINSRDWLDDPHLRFVLDPGVLRLRRVLGDVQLLRLDALTDSVRGVLPSDSDLSHEPAGANFRLYFTGDLRRYEMDWQPSTWVRYGPSLREMPGEYACFEGPRLLARRLISRQARLMATYVVDEFVNKKDIYSLLVTVRDYGPLFLLALLNSRFVSFWYVSQSMVASRDDFPQVTLADLRVLPIRGIGFTTPEAERARLVGEGKRLVEAFTSPHPRPPAAATPSPLHSVERGGGWGRGEVPASGMATAAATPSLSTSGEGGGQRVGEVPYAAFLKSPLGRWLDERLTAQHTPDPELVRQHNADPVNGDWQLPEAGPVEQSDVVHDLLAHLAGQMIEMNKQKQAEVKGFLQYLERQIGAVVDDLTGKTRLQGYLGDYQKDEGHLSFEGLLEVLRKNQRKLAVDPSGRAFQERLQQEYEASLAKLLPLKARLAATDRLIDLIVYRLYGLTEEEVAVVEGAGR
ncbi:MAG: Eco57I restriction-modification methylase domain-containing protein [Anaerolineae bacterium]